MRSLDEVRDQLAYHPATPETAEQHAAIRDAYLAFAEELWPLLPEGPERTLVFRDLQRSQMYANLSVALQAPADLGPTRSVARVLPD